MLVRSSWVDVKKYLQNAAEVYEKMRCLKEAVVRGGKVGARIRDKVKEMMQGCENGEKEARGVYGYVMAVVRVVDE
jgi:hypothetical protein